jgi:LacI family transcriptional regulator
MGRLLPEGGRIVMIAGLLDIAGHRAREAGFRDILAERHPQCALVSVLETGEDPAVAGRMTAGAFRQDPGLRGLYHTSVGALSIVQALERIGRLADTVVITHELTPNRRRLLLERRIDAVIDQGPLFEAQLAVETMARLLGRLPGEATSVSTGIQIFMPENA